MESGTSAIYLIFLIEIVCFPNLGLVLYYNFEVAQRF